MAAVVAEGIASGRLSAMGRGQDHPVADNRKEGGRALNRRVEVVKKQGQGAKAAGQQLQPLPFLQISAY